MSTTTTHDGSSPTELTVRALLSGFIIGAMLAMGNVYMGLKTGWWDSGNITAAILGFALLQVLRPFGSGTPSPRENNIVQATAAAVGAMPATAGLLGAVPALSLMGHGYSSLTIFGWGLGLGLIGIAIAVPLRRRMLVDESLPFPTGIATAEIIGAMHAAGRAAIARARAVLGSFAGAMIVVWFRDGRPAWIPALTAFPGRLFGVPAEALTWGVSWSPILLGTGPLVGPRLGLSILFGACVAWGLIAPLLVRHGLVAAASYSSLREWLLWPGVALMLSGALVQLALQARTFGRTLADLRRLRAGPTSAGGPTRPGRTRPGRTGLGIGVAALAGVALTVSVGHFGFGLRPLAVLTAIVLSILTASLCARCVGETDTVPLSQMGQLTQLVLAGLSPGQPAAGIATASVIAGDAAQTATTMSSLKTTHLLGGSPARLVTAQLCGAVVGTLLSVPVYRLVVHAYGLGSQALPAPPAAVWRSVAELTSRAGAALPPHAGAAAGIALALGAVLAFLGRTRAGGYLPSAVAAGAAFIMPAHYAVAICLGSLLYALARAFRPDATERYAQAIGAGAAAGEAFMGVLLALLIGLGVVARG